MPQAFLLSLLDIPKHGYLVQDKGETYANKMLKYSKDYFSS